MAILGFLAHPGLSAESPHGVSGNYGLLDQIEPRQNIEISDAKISDAMKGKIPSWWLPDAIIRVSAMPVAITGKIDKLRLRNEHGKFP